MLECSFCYSGSQDDYLFTDCNHLVCIDCASAKWDRKYSLKCCNKITYLSEETALILERLNQAERSNVKLYEKENRENSYEIHRVNLTKSKENTPRKDQQLEQSYCQKLRLEESGMVRTPENKADSMFIDIQDKQKEENLVLMEKILSEQISKVKYEFQCQRKELQKKQQVMLKDLYNTYSAHLNNLHSTCTHFDVSTLKDKLNRLTGKTYEAAKVSLPVTLEREERQDKILEKLDYNQQKMKEKLHKHYELLK